MIGLIYFVLWVFYPVFLVLNKVKRWAERYSDPSTHHAYIVNNWHKFPNDPQVGR